MLNVYLCLKQHQVMSIFLEKTFCNIVKIHQCRLYKITKSYRFLITFNEKCQEKVKTNKLFLCKFVLLQQNKNWLSCRL